MNLKNGFGTCFYQPMDETINPNMEKALFD